MVMEDPMVKEMEMLVSSLSTAIKEGNVEEAKLKASQLAEKKAVIDMMLEPQDASKDKIISVNIHIEDMVTVTSRPIQWNLKVSTKIEQLKRLMHKEKGFRPDVQRWIVEKRLAADTDSLSRCGVSSDGHTIFLYIMSRKPKVTQPGLQDDVQPSSRYQEPAVSSGPATLPAQPVQSPVIQDAGARSMFVRESPAQNPQPAPGSQQQQQQQQQQEETLQLGWNCPQCTYLNEPLQSSCIMCRESRPTDFISPDSPAEQQQQQEEIRPPSPAHVYPSRPSRRPEVSGVGDRQDSPARTARPSSPIMVYNHDKMVYEYKYSRSQTEGAAAEQESSFDVVG